MGIAKEDRFSIEKSSGCLVIMVNSEGEFTEKSILKEIEHITRDNPGLKIQGDGSQATSQVLLGFLHLEKNGIPKWVTVKESYTIRRNN